MSDEDRVMDDILGTPEPEAQQGDSGEAPQGDPEPTEEAGDGEQESGEQAEAQGDEPKADEQKFFYFDEDEVKDLPPEAVAKLAAKDRMLRNRFTQKRQQDAEAHRRAMAELREQQDRLQDKVMELALRALPASERAATPARDPDEEAFVESTVKEMVEEGWDEPVARKQAERMLKAAQLQAKRATAPLVEEVSTARLREQAEQAVSSVRSRSGLAAEQWQAVEAEMERLVTTDPRVQQVVAAIGTPEARAEYLYALASAAAPKPPSKPSDDEVRKAAREVLQKKAASPTKGGAQQSGQAPEKKPIDDFMSDLFTKSTPYG